MPGHWRVVAHSVAWQYFPEPVQRRAERALEAMGMAATPDAPLAQVAMEADDRTPGAALTLRVWPGGTTIPLARIDFHGRWIRHGRAAAPRRMGAEPGAAPPGQGFHA